MSGPRDGIEIVLLEPEHNTNIGAVARAMKNFGFGTLHLVAPRQYDFARARVTACWAEDVLEGAVIHASLEDALAGMNDVIGFTKRQGKNHPPQQDVRDWRAQHRPAGRTALLFGPEDTGLTNEHLKWCRATVAIPSEDECPSLNLAQAVMVVLWEIARSDVPREAACRSPAELPAQWREQEVAVRRTAEILEKVGFFDEHTPRDLPGLVGNLLRRIQPTDREVQILLGVLKRIARAVTAGRPSPSDQPGRGSEGADSPSPERDTNG